MKNFLSIFKKPKKEDTSIKEEQALADFKLKFYTFQSLLSINNEVLNIMTNLEKLKKSKHIFLMEDLRIQLVNLEVKIYKFIRNLNELSLDKYIELYDRLKDILSKINEKLQQKDMPLTIFLKKITKEMNMLVGGKNTHLGELKRLGTPVPEGFAITTYGYEKFINYQGLHNKIIEFLQMFDTENLEASLKICQQIHELIMKQALPPELEKEFLDSYVNLGEHEGDIFNIAVRSSAVGEDSEKSSYAGQYSSVLNVSEHTLFDAFRKVIASKYNLRAILYQINIGLKNFDIPMAVCCVKMVNAKAAGVIYTIDPIHYDGKSDNSIIINAVWGLGEYLVEGAEPPDQYIVSKNPLNIKSKKIAAQKKMLVCIDDINGGVEEIDVPKELTEKPCLTDKQILKLSNYAIQIEDYYKKPQDIEWVLDQNDNLVIVQSRTLQIVSQTKKIKKNVIENLKQEILINKGDIISQGVAAGIAYHVKNTADIFNFPQNAVLVIEKSSPVYSILLTKAKAVIADIGGITGHLASVIRQFNVPAIFNTGNASKVIPHGEPITVDAYNGIVLKGEIKELLDEEKQNIEIKNFEDESPMHKTLSEILNFIVPLNLTDPKSSNFTANNCQTLHDITRFSHELAVQTMFRVSNNKNTKEIGSAKQLFIDIPLNIYIIDLGDGIKEMKNKNVTVDQITSIPMLAILKGMRRKDLRWAGPTNIDFQGFFSVLTHVAMSPPDYDRPLGEGSYFAVSKNYMNFNSRLAYHFATIDAYCSDITNNNYITFSFKGGAASLDRRLNRIKFLIKVLEQLGFVITTNEDLLKASIYKYEQTIMEEKLDLLGRLMCFSRQLDMIMRNDNIINLYAEAFLNENYSFHYS